MSKLVIIIFITDFLRKVKSKNKATAVCPILFYSIFSRG